MRHAVRWLACVLFAAATTAAQTTLGAQDYPGKSLTLVAPAWAGTPSDTLARIVAEQRIEPDAIVGHCLRLLFREPPPRTGQREPLDKQQVLELQHPLEVGTAIDTRASLRLRHAEIRELRLPRSQYVRLNLGDLTHLRLPEQRAVRDLYGGHSGQHRGAAPVYQTEGSRVTGF